MLSLAAMRNVAEAPWGRNAMGPNCGHDGQFIDPEQDLKLASVFRARSMIAGDGVCSRQ